MALKNTYIYHGCEYLFFVFREDGFFHPVLSYSLYILWFPFHLKRVFSAELSHHDHSTKSWKQREAILKFPAKLLKAYSSGYAQKSFQIAACRLL